MASGSLTYLVGCGVKRNDHFQIKTRHHHCFTRRYGNSVQTTEGNDNESILFRSILFFLGAYSDKGREGMMSSSYDARVKAVSAMVEKAGAKLGSVDYLQGPFDVIADAEVDSYETASGLQAIMMASGGWDELLLLPTMDIDKALNVARTVGGYPMPGNE